MKRTVLHPDFDLCVDDNVDRYAVVRLADEADATALLIDQSVLTLARLAAKMLAIADYVPLCRPLSHRVVFNSPGAQ